MTTSSPINTHHRPQGMMATTATVLFALLIFDTFTNIALPCIAAAEAAPSTTSSSSDLPGHYRALWRSFAKSNTFFASSTYLTNASRASELHRLLTHSSLFYIDLGLPSSGSRLLSGGQVPFAVASVAVAFNVFGGNTPTSGTGDVGMELTVAQLAWLLRGDAPTTFLVNTLNNKIQSMNFIPVLVRSGSSNGSAPTPPDYPWLECVLRGVEDLPATSPIFATPSEKAALTLGFIEKVEANAKVVWHDSEEMAVEFVKSPGHVSSSTPTAFIALTTFATSVVFKAPVASMLVPHPTSPSTLVKSYPQIDLQTSFVDFDTTTLTATVNSAVTAVYPLTIVATMMINSNATCAAGFTTMQQQRWVHQLVSIINAKVAEWHMAPLPSFDLNKLVGNALHAGCGKNVMNIDSRGSSVLQDLLTGLSSQHFHNMFFKSLHHGEGIDEDDDGHNEIAQQMTDTTSLGTFFSYSGGGSGGGLKALKAGDNPIVGSDSLFTEEEYAQHPTLQFVPLISFGVSLAFNIPGVTSLVLPRCIVVGIFTGRITFWDHPEILQFNPIASLPHVPINVWARTSRSGTTGIFTAGLRAMDTVCTNDNPTVEFTKTWNIDFPNINLASSTGGMLQGVLKTPYSIGYAGSATVRLLNLNEAILVDEATMTFTSPQDEFIQGAVTAAAFDAVKNVLTFTKEATPNAYPFAGVSYLVFDRDAQGNCSIMRSALEFARWVITSTAARGYASTHHFTPLPESTMAAAEATLVQAKCDGAWTIPRLEEQEEDSTTTTVLAAAIPSLVFTIVTIVVIVSRDKGKNNRHAPGIGDSDSSDVTILFTDIESSTALWARGPVAMGPALDQHNEIVRAAIARNKCYEVKIIGDAFMIACRTAQQGVSLAVDIQRNLFTAQWDADINAMYEELQEEKGNHLSTPADVWNGLRVRVGLCTGPVSTKQDPINGGYDYYGSTVNMASRVEATGHGGQIVVTPSVVDALGDTVNEFFKDLDVMRTSLGTVELRGFDEVISLVQLLPQEVSSRQFGDLRLNAIDKVTDNSSSEVPDEEHSTISGTTDRQTTESGYLPVTRATSGVGFNESTTATATAKAFIASEQELDDEIGGGGFNSSATPPLAHSSEHLSTYALPFKTSGSSMVDADHRGAERPTQVILSDINNPTNNVGTHLAAPLPHVVPSRGEASSSSQLAHELGSISDSLGGPAPSAHNGRRISMSIGISTNTASQHSSQSPHELQVATSLLSALFQPLSTEQKATMLENLCGSWRIQYSRRKPTAEMLENLSRRALAVARENKRRGERRTSQTAPKDGR